MFIHAIADNVEIRLIEARHANSLYMLVQQNYKRLLVWCPWLDDVATLGQTQEFINTKLQRFEDGNGFTAGIFDHDRMVGVISLEYVDRANRTTEIGYWLDADAEGRGIAINACRHLIDHAFNELGLNRVQIRCASDNIRSRAVPEKLGFIEEGCLRQCEKLEDRTVDLIVYGLLANEWKSPN